MRPRSRHPAGWLPLVRQGAVALAALVTAACGPTHGPAFVRSMREADDAAEHGDLREAATRFERAGDVALLRADRDQARHAAARLWARAGELGRAMARLDALADEAPPGPEAGSAFYDRAALRLAHGDVDGGWRDMEAMVRRFPGDGDARPALHHWLAHLDETDGPAAALAWLRTVEPALDATDRGEEVAYEVAVRLERLGNAVEARAAFVAVAQRWPYPGGSLWDDALFHASLLDEAAGRFLEAAADLDQLLDRRERALIIGSSERSRYAEAELRLGELYRDRLGDHAKARRAFHALYANFKDSVLRDRGLFEEAQLSVRDGDPQAACAALATLVRELPGSRYAPCAVRLCPTATVTSDAGAAPACHEYLLDRGRDPGSR